MWLCNMWYVTTPLSHCRRQIADLERQLQMDEDEKEELLGEVRS